MSYRTVTGTGYPIIQLNFTGRDPVTYNFPLTSEGDGLVEDWRLEDDGKIEHRLLDLTTNKTTLAQEIIGWRGYFTLNYNTTLPQSTLFQMQVLLRTAKQSGTIWLTPRNDVTQGRFDVLYISGSFPLTITKGGTNAWHKNITLEFATKELYDEPPMFDPNDLIRIWQPEYRVSV